MVDWLEKIPVPIVLVIVLVATGLYVGPAFLIIHVEAHLLGGVVLFTLPWYWFVEVACSIVFIVALVLFLLDYFYDILGGDVEP